MFSLIKLIVILLGNFIIYQSSQNSPLGIVLATLLSTIFEYSLLWLIETLSKEKKILPSLFVLVFGIFKVGLSLYYNHFGDYYIFSRLKQAKHLAGVEDFFRVELLRPNLILVYILTGLLIYFIHKKEPEEKKFKGVFKRPYFIYGSLGLFVLMAGTNLFAGAGEMYTYAFKSFKKEDSHVQALDSDKLEYLSQVLFRNYGHKNPYTGLGQGKNLLVIQVESLQNFFIDQEVQGVEVTPFLKSLVEKNGSIYFTNYHELLGFGNSSDAEYVSLHSAYPNTIDASFVTYKDTQTFGLPKIATSKGYQSLSMHGNTGKYYGRNIYHKNVGFERSYFGEDFVQDEEILMGLGDGSFFRQSIPILEDASESGPYFGFMITLSSHIPFDMPEDLRVFSTMEGLSPNNLYKYMDSIHYLDRELEKFLKAMEDKGLLENTVVAIYGDHSAMEISNKESNSNMLEYLDRPYTYHDMQNVPLILLVPGLDKNIRVDSLGSQVDFLPTILNIMGWNEEVVPMFGIDLLDEDLSRDNCVFPQTHLLKGSYYKDDIIFEKTRVPGADGGTVYKDGKTFDQDHLDRTSLAGMRLIDYSNYLYDKDLLKDQVQKFKEKIDK